MKLNKKRLIIGVGIIVILILLMAIPLGNGDRRKNEEEKSEVTKEFDSQREVADDVAENLKQKENSEKDNNSGKKQDKKNQKEKDKSVNSDSSTGQTTIVDHTTSNNNSQSDSTEKKPVSSSKPEEKYPQIAGGKLTCDSFGRYNGHYVEDGRDELIESVAAILVTNKSDEYLEYATLTFDVNGNAANFIVTGLPSGSSAWVLDANKLTIESGAAFTYQECVSDFRTDVDAKSDKVGLSADGNMLTATNKTDETMEDVVVYYKVMHTDGNYLGGITYTANFDTLESGESTEVVAGHYSADDSEIVRVSWGNQ